MRIRKLMYVAAVAIAGTMFAACSNGNTAKSTDESADSIAAENTEAPAAEEVAAVNEDAVINLSDDNLLRPNKSFDEAVFIDFNATWCVPCKKFGPTFENAASKYGDRAKFYSVDIDVNAETAKAFGIESVPTIIVIKKNGTVDRYVGIGDVLPSEKFEAIVEKAL